MEKASRRMWEQLLAKDSKVAAEIDVKVRLCHAPAPGHALDPRHAYMHACMHVRSPLHRAA